MTTFKPSAPGRAYLISGDAFPADGATINAALPFYARQIADGDLIPFVSRDENHSGVTLADSSSKSVAGPSGAPSGEKSPSRGRAGKK